MQEAGVQNVTVKTTTLRGTQNGLRIKTWARPSNGFVNGVLFQNSIMVNVRFPIIIDQSYCPNSNSCPGQVKFIKFQPPKFIKLSKGYSGKLPKYVFEALPFASIF